MKQLTQARLRELLHYCPDTGVFAWLVYRNHRAGPGDVAGRVGKRGYRQIVVDCHMYSAQRLAVLYMTGQWPQFQVDHKHGIRHDNRWSELRELTQAENMQNLQRAHCDNKSGLLGVAPVRDRFGAYIRADGKNRYLGTFDTPQLAHEAYLSAKRVLHPAGNL